MDSFKVRELGDSEYPDVFDDWSIGKDTDFPLHAQSHIKGWGGAGTPAVYAARRVFAADPFQAAVEVQTQLEQVRALRLLAQDSLSLSWSSECYVYSSRAKEGHLLLTTALPLIGTPSKVPISGHRLKQARNLASRLYKNFDEISKERITRALSTGAVAADTAQEEIQLTSLWASLEVFLGDPPEEGSRISHFIDAIAPCICIRYHRRLFVAIHDHLSVQYRTKFFRTLKSVRPKIKSNSHTTFAKLIVLPQYAADLEGLLAICSGNPFLTHRLWRLHKFYSQPSECLKTIKGHHDRVSWQLNRIYRVRNSLVHSGRSPSYTDMLVRNTLEYLRSAIITTVRMSAKPGSSKNLDQIIAEIGFEWQAMLRALADAKAKPFDERLAHHVFSAL